MYEMVKKEKGITKRQKEIGKCNLSNKADQDILQRKQLSISNFQSVNLKSANQNNLNIIQMREGEESKLVVGRFGADPLSYVEVGTNNIRGVGLTCHHIIPDQMLIEFYDYCKNPTKLVGGRVNFNTLLTNWESEAAKDVRQDGKRADNTRSNKRSLCAWMYGNIFIGPECTKRIDDMGDGEVFDYGGFDEESGESKLHRIFSKLVRWKAQKTKNAVEPALVREILEDLIKVAKEKKIVQGTATRGGANQQAGMPAYDITKWINVGQVQTVEAMRNDPVVLRQWKECYDYWKPDKEKLYTSKYKKCSQVHKDVIDTFIEKYEMYINEDKIKDNIPLLMSIHTYNNLNKIFVSVEKIPRD